MKFVELALVSMLGCASPDEVAPEPDPRWVERAPLLAPLQECAVVVLGQEVVVVGGLGEGAVTTPRVEAYDPSTDGWRALPDLPVPLHHANVAALDGWLHVVGHLAPSFDEAAGVYALAPGAADWEVRAPMPTHLARGSAAVGVLDGRIHVVGGLRDGAPSALHTVYDPVTDAWEELPDAPVARDHGGAAVIDGVLYVVGGRDGTIAGHVGLLHAFDGQRWEVRAEMPTSRGGLAVAALDGRLHALGGEGADGGGVFYDHEVYDPVADAWEALGPMRTPRHGTGAAAFDGALLVPGGADVQGLGAVAVHEAWTR